MKRRLLRLESPDESLSEVFELASVIRPARRSTDVMGEARGAASACFMVLAPVSCAALVGIHALVGTQRR
jgi:hypothetical protein